MKIGKLARKKKSSKVPHAISPQIQSFLFIFVRQQLWKIWFSGGSWLQNHCLNYTHMNDQTKQPGKNIFLHLRQPLITKMCSVWKLPLFYENTTWGKSQIFLKKFSPNWLVQTLHTKPKAFEGVILQLEKSGCLKLEKLQENCDERGICRHSNDVALDLEHKI